MGRAGHENKRPKFLSGDSPASRRGGGTLCGPAGIPGLLLFWEKKNGMQMEMGGPMFRMMSVTLVGQVLPGEFSRGKYAGSDGGEKIRTE